MRKHDSKAKKIEKNKKPNESLDKFYSPQQKQAEQLKEQHKKEKKSHQDVEMEIFEHLKNHTKKVLKEKDNSK